MKKIIASFFMLTLKVFAEVEPIVQDENLSEVLSKSSYEPNYFKMLFGLFIVIGLIYFTGIVYQKLTKVKLNQDEDELFRIDLITSSSLGQNKSLHVIKVNDEYCLIGASQNNISLLKKLEPPKQNKFEEMED